MRLTWRFSLKRFIHTIWFGKNSTSCYSGWTDQPKGIPPSTLSALSWKSDELMAWETFARFISPWASWTLCVKAFLPEGFWSLLRLIYCLILFSQPVCCIQKSRRYSGSLRALKSGEVISGTSLTAKTAAKCKSLTYDHFRAVKLDFRAAYSSCLSLSLSLSSYARIPLYVKNENFQQFTINFTLYNLAPGQICPLASDHHGLLIIPIHWLASLLCLLFTSKLVCGGRSGAIWMLHMVVVEEIPPSV